MYFLIRDRIEKVTPEDVNKAASKYLTQSNRTVGIYVPTTTPQRTSVPPRPDITAVVESYKGREAKSAGEALDTAPMAIESRIQKPANIEGIKVAVLPKKTRDEMVYLMLTLRYGNESNLKGMNEAASFLVPLMSRETKKLSHQQIQDELAKNVARLGGGFGGGGGRRGGGGGGGGGGLGVATFNVQVGARISPRFWRSSVKSCANPRCRRLSSKR